MALEGGEGHLSCLLPFNEQKQQGRNRNVVPLRNPENLCRGILPKEPQGLVLSQALLVVWRPEPSLLIIWAKECILYEVEINVQTSYNVT